MAEMKGTPLTQAEMGEYEVLADYTEGELVHLLMRRPTDPGNSIYYYALPRRQVSVQTTTEVGNKPVLAAGKRNGEMFYTIYCSPI